MSVGRSLDLDVRGIIGLVAVSGLFGIVFTQLFQGRAVAVPPEVAGVVGSVIGFYFGSRGGTSSGEASVPTRRSVLGTVLLVIVLPVVGLGGLGMIGH